MGYFNNPDGLKSYGIPNFQQICKKLDRMTKCPICGGEIIQADTYPRGYEFEYKVPSVYGNKSIIIPELLIDRWLNSFSETEKLMLDEYISLEPSNEFVIQSKLF